MYPPIFHGQIRQFLAPEAYNTDEYLQYKNQ